MRANSLCEVFFVATIANFNSLLSLVGLMNLVAPMKTVGYTRGLMTCPASRAVSRKVAYDADQDVLSLRAAFPQGILPGACFKYLERVKVQILTNRSVSQGVEQGLDGVTEAEIAGDEGSTTIDLRPPV